MSEFSTRGNCWKTMHLKLRNHFEMILNFIFEICLLKKFDERYHLKLRNHFEIILNFIFEICLLKKFDQRYQTFLKKVPTLSFLSKIVLDFSIITSRVFCVLWFLRKPARCFENLLCIWSLIYSNSSFSNTFKMVEGILTGR